MSSRKSLIVYCFLAVSAFPFMEPICGAAPPPATVIRVLYDAGESRRTPVNFQVVAPREASPSTYSHSASVA